ATLVDSPRIARKEIQPFTPEQAREFLESMRGDRLEALYSVAMAIGLRQGEALGLRWTNVDMNAGKLTVTHSLQRIERKLQLVATKRERSRRTIMLPQVCLSALRAHRVRQERERAQAGKRWQETGFVFTTTIGTSMDGQRPRIDFRRRLKLRI